VAAAFENSKEGEAMAFKPNYNQQRAERDRQKRAKREEKLKLKEERTAQRKGTGEETAGEAEPPKEG
jgi:hypothetical protein